MEDTLEDSFLESALTNELLTLDVQFPELEEAFLNNPNLDKLLETDLTSPQAGDCMNLSDFSFFDDEISSIGFLVDNHDSYELVDPQATSSSYSTDLSIYVVPESPELTQQVESTVRKTKLAVSSGRIKQKNKEATQRYRSKKLQERAKLFAEVDRYEKLNKELRAKIEDIQSEVNLIKSLLVQVYLAKK